MTITQSSAVKREVPGARYETVTVVLCDAAYPNTGATVGYPLTPQLLQFQGYISFAEVMDNCDTSGANQGWIDPTTGNLRVSAAGVEITNGTSLAGIKFRIKARGV